MDKREEKKRRRIGTILVSVLLGITAVLCMLVIAQVLSKGYVSLAGHSLFRVVTGSMEPEIPVGALLITAETDVQEIAQEDIICFRSAEPGMLGRVITHRVTAVVTGSDGWVLLETKGDANLTKDAGYVTESNLIGRVIWHSKEGNLLAGMVTLMSNKIGFLACIVFPVLLIAGIILRDCVKSIRQELRDARQELEEPDAGREAEKEEADGKSPLNPEEYQELCGRLRAELMEELKQGEQGEMGEMGEKKE